MSGTQPVIPFNEIPSTWEVPSTKIEVRALYQQVGILPLPARTLIIAQMTSAGTAAANAVVPNVTQQAAGTAYGGAGSQVDGMVNAYLNNNETVPLDIICVTDASGSAAAVWTHTFGATLTGNGSPAMNIAGVRVSIGSLAGDTVSTQATEWAAAINALPNLPVTASAAAGVVTVTAKNAGLAANDIQFVISPADGDTLPAGMTLTVAQTVQGATNPSTALTNALALVATRWYTDIIIPWQDSTNVAALAAEAERRFNAMVNLDMRGHVPFTGTFSQQLSKAASANARFIYASPLTAPQSPPWVVAAAAAAAASQALINDPSRQLNGIALAGVVGPVMANLPPEAEKELLLTGGCSVFHVAHDYTVQMERYVSTYTTNAQGIADPAWAGDIMIAAVATAIRYDWKTYWELTYPRNKLAPDGSLAALADSTIVTPTRARGSWAARCQKYATNGWIVDEVNQAKRSLFVIDPNDPNRLDSQIFYTRIGNMIVNAGVLSFNVGGV